MRIKTVLVDDEESAIITMSAILEDKFSEDIEVVGTANSVDQAIRIIESTKPLLVLLDIEMPKRDGFDLLEAFPDQPFKVVFVTAHEEYAIRAIRSEALDYLLKPVDLDDIKAMIEKFKARFDVSEEIEDDDKIIGIRNRRGWVFIRKGDIIYIENRHGVPNFIMKDKTNHIGSKRLGDYEEVLGEMFYRAHNSYIVNVKEINQYDTSEGGEIILKDGVRIPVARRRGQGLVEIMKKMA